MIIKAKDKNKLLKDEILWLSTVNSKNHPHLVPIWFFFENEKLNVYTSEKSVKVKNIKTNPNVSFALDGGYSPVCGNGTASIRSINEKHDLKIIQGFKKKYNWDILKDHSYNILIEIEIKNMLMQQNPDEKN